MANQQLPPDAIITQTNLSGAVTDIDEDPASPDGVWLTEGDDALDTVLLVSFATPTITLNTGAGLQTFNIYCRRSTTAGGNDPTLDVALYESGTLVTSISTGISITSTTGQLVTVTWDAADLGTADGSNVELWCGGMRSGGSPSGRRTVEFDAVEWKTDYTAATTHAGAGSITGDGTLSADALVSKVGAGSFTTSVTVVGAALVFKVGAGSITTYATVVGDVLINSSPTGTVSTTGTLVGAALVSKVAVGSITGDGTLAAAALVSKVAAGAIATTGTLVGAALVSKVADGSITTSATVSGDVIINSSPTGTVSTTGTLVGAATRTPVSTAYTDAAATNYLEIQVANAIVNNTGYTAGASIYLALHTSDPTETGAVDEVSVAFNYARELVTFAQIDVITQALDTEVVFTATGGAWGTISHYSIWDASSAGNALIYGVLDVPYSMADGNSLTFETDNFRVRASSSTDIEATGTSFIEAAVRNISYSSGSTSFLISLHSADPGTTGNSNELTGNGYSRQAATLSQADGLISLASKVRFLAAGGAWSGVTDYVVRNSSGDPIFSAPLTTTKTLADGDALDFAASSITMAVK